jgi:WD40 repeat protein
VEFFDAFISYGRADSKAFAAKLNEKLLAEGLNIWFDQDDIPLGVDFQEQINDGIRKAHNFLFIIAPHSINSPYCLKEIELAIKLNKRIIPLLHVEQISYETWQQRNPNKTEEQWQEYQQKGLHSSYPNMHPVIGKINWVYFRENLDDFHKSYIGLLSVMSKHQDYVKQHTNFLLQALEWLNNQRQNQYLLIGEVREQAETWLKQKFTTEQQPCLPTDLHCEFICESTRNADNSLSEIFIAYSEQDKKIQGKIRKTLMRESFTIWTNKSDIKTGTTCQEIHEGIEEADNFIYLLSSTSLKSEYCQSELNHALANNKHVITLLTEKIDIELIPQELKNLQFIDFTELENEDQYQLSINKLLGELKEEASYHDKHKRLLVKALKWQKQNHSPSLLLRGYNLQEFEAWLKVAKKHETCPSLPLQEEFIDASINKPQESALEVFLSYTHSDLDLALKLNDALQELGKTTWFDQESIPKEVDVQHEIYRGIQSSENFIFIISPRSVKDQSATAELEYAQKLNKRIISILYQPLSEDEQQKLPPSLASIKWVDFSDNEGEFAANFQELVMSLNTDRDHVRSHTKWSQRALEWEEKNKSTDLLLRGSEFSIAEEWLKTAELEQKNPLPTALQKELITQSLAAIEARKKQEKRQLLILRSLLVGTSIALVGAIGGGVLAWREWRRSELNQAESLAHYSLSLLSQHKELDAFIKAIKAGKMLKYHHVSDPQVMNALQEVISQKSEFNRLEKHDGFVVTVSFSPDSQTIASGSWDNTIKLWDVKTGKEIRTLYGHDDAVYSVSFSPDGKTLASSGADNTIRLWDVQTGEEIRTIRGHNNYVFTVSFSPDGKTLASGSSDKTIKLWNVETGQEIRTLEGHKNYVMTTAFSPDGKTLASSGWEKTIKLWDVETGKEIRTLEGHKNYIYTVLFSPDGKTLASGSNDKTIKLWDVETGKKIKTFYGHDYYIFSLSFSPDGKTLASGSADNTAKLWNLETGKEIRTLQGHDDSVRSISFSPDGQTLVTGSWDTTLKLWNVETGKKIYSLQGHDNSVYSVSFSPDKKSLASGSLDRTIKLWNLETGKEIHTLEGHNGYVYNVSYNPDGKILASNSWDGVIKLWNPDTGKEIRTLKGHKKPVNSVSFSPDGKTLASGSNDKTIKLWNPDTGKEIRTIQGHKKPVNSVSFSPDGKTLASGSNDKTIKLWNPDTGKEIRTIQGHKEPINSVTFSPDGKILASGSRDNTVKLWDVETGQEIRTVRGHQKSVNSVSFSPDGKTLASGSLDKMIKLWNVATGEELPVLQKHEKSVYAVSFSPDGQTLASGSDDKTIKLWTMNKLSPDLDSLMETSCNWVSNYLENNPNVSDSDRQLCKGVGSKK